MWFYMLKYIQKYCIFVCVFYRNESNIKGGIITERSVKMIPRFYLKELNADMKRVPYNDGLVLLVWCACSSVAH